MASDQPKNQLAKNVGIMLPSVGDLSAAADKLADALSKVGIRLFNSTPKQIVDREEAKAKARLIRAQAKIDEQDLYIQAKIRRRTQEERRQLNINSIASQASDKLPSQISTVMPSEDWVWQFIEHAQDVGDVEMQDIWSSLLAGEVATPGKYSLVTLAKVKTMTPKVANYFTEILGCTWTINKQPEKVLLTKTRADGWSGDLGFDVNKIRTLDLHGLVKYESNFMIDLAVVSELEYFKRLFKIEFHAKPSSSGDFIRTPSFTEYLTSHASLTDVGLELFDIAYGQENILYMNDVLDWIKSSDRSSEKTKVEEITV